MALNLLFVYFVCFVVQFALLCPIMSFCVHSCPFVALNLLFVYFVCFVFFVVHPPFVSIRGYSNLFPLEGGMCFGVYFDKLRDIDMGINLRSCQSAMAQHFLDRSQVCPCCEEMSCE